MWGIATGSCGGRNERPEYASGGVAGGSWSGTLRGCASRSPLSGASVPLGPDRARPLLSVHLRFCRLARYFSACEVAPPDAQMTLPSRLPPGPQGP